jgi:hypothetical protein
VTATSLQGTTNRPALTRIANRPCDSNTAGAQKIWTLGPPNANPSSTCYTAHAGHTVYQLKSACSEDSQ